MKSKMPPMTKASRPKKAPKGVEAMAQKPMKMAKKAATPGLSFKAPAGNPQLKFAPEKKPKEMKTDRGTFGMK
jgi:hypothetical protein